MSTLQPKFDRVLIERDEMKSLGGIILPEDVTRKNQPAAGTVVAIGPTVGYKDEDGVFINDAIKVGSKVIFARHAGVEVEDPASQKKFWLIQDLDVLCEIITTE